MAQRSMDFIFNIMAAAKAKKRKSSKKPSAAQLRARRAFAAAAKARSKAARAKKRAGASARKPRVASKKRPTAASARKPRAAAKRKRNKTVIVKPKRVLVLNGKKRAAKKKRLNPRSVTPKVKAMAEMFSGRRVNRVDVLNCSDGTPTNLAKLGKLVLIKTERGTIKPASGNTYLCADAKGKLHLATSAAKLYDGPRQNFGEVSQVEYETKKPHLGYKNPTIFFHKMGEEGGKRPTLIADGKGGLKFRGGSYKIKREGIVN